MMHIKKFTATQPLPFPKRIGDLILADRPPPPVTITDPAKDWTKVIIIFRKNRPNPKSCRPQKRHPLWGFSASARAQSQSPEP